MSHKKNNEPVKIKNYFILGSIIIALFVLNIWYLKKYLSFNAAYITDYQVKEDTLAQYRHPAVAGLFYKAQAEELEKDIKKYVDGGKFLSYSNYMPKMIIVPHAGYIYSAGTAGKAYAALQKHAKSIKNVVLVGPSHFYGGQGAFLSDIDYFSTPLGDIAVNKEIVKEIASENEQFLINNQAHVKEHSLEVQLPFIQKVLPNAKIVPIIYGNIEPEILAKGVQKYVKQPNTILVISADLSHYHSYDKAQETDRNSAKKIEKGEQLTNHESCGAIGINAAMLLAKEGHYYPQMLELVNSGDTAGDKDSVVGYGAWSFYSDREVPKLSKLEKEIESLNEFSKLYAEHLKNIAKTSIERAVKSKKHYSPSKSHFPEDVFDKGASFVTLYKKGELRGCIGTVLPVSSIAQDIANNAYAAALEDSRFPPVTEEELPDLSYSIALLSGFEKINYTNEADVIEQIKANVDGLIIRDGNRQGVFLPAVWKELPNKEDFFKHLKIKAGMNPNYWNNRIVVYRFRTVEIKDEN